MTDRGTARPLTGIITQPEPPSGPDRPFVHLRSGGPARRPTSGGGRRAQRRWRRCRAAKHTCLARAPLPSAGAPPPPAAGRVPSRPHQLGERTAPPPPPVIGGRGRRVADGQPSLVRVLIIRPASQSAGPPRQVWRKPTPQQSVYRSGYAIRGKSQPNPASYSPRVGSFSRYTT